MTIARPRRYEGTYSRKAQTNSPAGATRTSIAPKSLRTRHTLEDKQTTMQEAIAEHIPDGAIIAGFELIIPGAVRRTEPPLDVHRLLGEVDPTGMIAGEWKDRLDREEWQWTLS